MGGRRKNHKAHLRGPTKKKTGKAKKPDAIHGIKAGEKGEAAQYIPRAQALAKLQLPLADFRKLCILKGIYPRDPKKKTAGNDKTYYHKKDIAFLAHEPLLNKFFELKTFMKKFKRLMGRQEFSLARGTESRQPKYTLHHLVRERYQTFEDALRDMDDAVSMLALFQSLSADHRRDIPTEAIDEATRLYQEFQLYCIRSQALRKTFASIKGYYFQVEIHGVTITWLAPHQFSQELPVEVDFRVMLTFLEFYRAMLKFVNYRLYADLGLAYPPKRDESKEKFSGEVAALEVEMREAGKAQQANKEAGDKVDAEVSAAVAEDFGQENEEAAEMQRRLAEQTRMKSTFRGLKLFINREVPLRPMYFTLLCGGADEVGWERGATTTSIAPGSAFGVDGEGITHQIVDRPLDQIKKREGREYVQPQWVFDSFNVGCQLPIALYAPGRAPPPHLSPFVDDKAEGYVPRQRELLDKLASEAGVAVSSATDSQMPGATASGAPKVQKTEFESFDEELRAESSGVWHSQFQETQDEERKKRTEQAIKDAEEAAEQKEEVLVNPALKYLQEGEPEEPKAKPSEQEEELLRQKALMSKKHKRLLNRIEHTQKTKSDANTRLRKKRRLLEEAGKN
mmetsp:Transcript_96271/g.201143  ORF Transcript_96271/g.201143 Transcript_96271/m.201143 type:complete len:623 (-) Transcript_96271:143-2011(-)